MVRSALVSSSEQSRKPQHFFITIITGLATAVPTVRMVSTADESLEETSYAAPTLY